MQGGYDSEYVKGVFSRTEILRRPISGIVSGYHNLPYILVGPDEHSDQNCIEVRGQIDVSPKFVITPSMLGPTYGELFKEEPEELMDRQILGRMFSFVYTNKYNVKLENKSLEVQRHPREPKQHLNNIVDRLDQQEVVNKGVIFSPNIRFYPVSIDKFINVILDREFGA